MSESTERSEVLPALTAEEWEHYFAEGTYGGDDLHMWLPNDKLRYFDEHETAAVNLQGQPFGFTWEDVLTLRAVGGHIARAALFDEFVGDGLLKASELLDGLADRIAALLPPRRA